MERNSPQTSEAAITAGCSGVCTKAAAVGRHSSRIPLRHEDRIRLRTVWNGNED